MKISNNLPSPQVTNLQNLLTNSQFVLPAYQRSYSWSSSQILDMLKDILSLVKGHEDLHFFGNIVSARSSKYGDELIDGQQRITTSLMFIAVIRNKAKNLINKLNKNGYTLKSQTASLLNIIETTSNNMLFGSLLSHKPKNLTLQVDNISTKPNQNYKQVFNGIIIDDRSHTFSNHIETSYQPIRLLFNAYKLLRTRVGHFISSKQSIGAKTRFLYKLFVAFSHGFYVTVLHTRSISDALTTYISLNTRGKALSISDRCKGTVASISDHYHKNVRETLSDWNTISSIFDDNDKVFTDFLIDYWQARYGFISRSHFARAFSLHVVKYNQLSVMFTNFHKLAPIYKELLNPFKNHMNYIICILKSLGFRWYRPVGLAIYGNRSYSDSDINKLLVLCLQLGIHKLVTHAVKMNVNIPYLMYRKYSMNDILNRLHHIDISRQLFIDGCHTYRPHSQKQLNMTAICLYFQYKRHNHSIYHSLFDFYKHYYIYNDVSLKKIRNNSKLFFKDYKFISNANLLKTLVK